LGYGNTFCIAKGCDDGAQDACNKAYEGIFANMGASGNARTNKIAEELEKQTKDGGDGRGFVDAMLASGKYVLLENLMRKQLMACICVNRGGGGVCYEGDDGIPRGKPWCSSITPSWARSGISRRLSPNLCRDTSPK
jgi:hypothetical protein